jgi:hypothetical protein
LGYILTLLFVPFAAPRLMGVDLKKEAAKLEAELAGGAPPKTENLAYQKFQATVRFALVLSRKPQCAGRTPRAQPPGETRPT